MPVPPPDPTTATLYAPDMPSGLCGLASDTFYVVLDQIATAAIMVSYSSSVPGDTFTPPSPQVIPVGNYYIEFSLIPSSGGDRSISITVAPVLIIAGSPVTYTGLMACPNDAGAVSRSRTWYAQNLCGIPLSLYYEIGIGTTAEKDLYCQNGGNISLTITE